MKITTSIRALCAVGLLLCFGCDSEEDEGSSDETDREVEGDGGPTDVIEEVGEFTVSGSNIVLKTALNADGSLIAVAMEDESLDDHVSIFSTADGSLVVEMKELGEAGEPFTGDASIEVDGLLWGTNDELTAILSYGNSYTWETGSGEVLEKTTDTSVSDPCAGPDDFKAFHPSRALAFTATQAFPADNTICKIDLATNTRETLTLAEGPVIEWVTFDVSSDLLWVSFSNPTEDNFLSREITATVAYDPFTMTPTGDELASGGEIIAAGSRYFVTRGPQLAIAPGGELNAYDERALVAPTGDVLIADISGAEDVNVIRLPEGRLIGTLPDDTAAARSFSADGKRLATVASDRTTVMIHDVSATTSMSAYLVEAVPPAGTLSGTISVDGEEQTLTGSCEVTTNESLGPVQFIAYAETSGGWKLRAHAQNLLLYTAYRLEKAGKVYENSSTIAQNLDLDAPTAESDGTSISGEASLLTFRTDEFFAPVEDATQPSGYETVEISVDASCEQ